MGVCTAPAILQVEGAVEIRTVQTLVALNERLYLVHALSQYRLRRNALLVLPPQRQVLLPRRDRPRYPGRKTAHSPAAAKLTSRSYFG